MLKLLNPANHMRPAEGGAFILQSPERGLLTFEEEVIYDNTLNLHEPWSSGRRCRLCREPSSVLMHFYAPVGLDDVDTTQSDHVKFCRCSRPLIFRPTNHQRNRKPAVKAISGAMHQCWPATTAAQIKAERRQDRRPSGGLVPRRIVSHEDFALRGTFDGSKSTPGGELRSSPGRGRSHSFRKAANAEGAQAIGRRWRPVPSAVQRSCFRLM